MQAQKVLGFVIFIGNNQCQFSLLKLATVFFVYVLHKV